MQPSSSKSSASSGLVYRNECVFLLGTFTKKRNETFGPKKTLSGDMCLGFRVYRGHSFFESPFFLAVVVVLLLYEMECFRVAAAAAAAFVCSLV